MKISEISAVSQLTPFFCFPCFQHTCPTLCQASASRQHWLLRSDRHRDGANTRHNHILTTRCTHSEPAPTSRSRGRPVRSKVVAPERRRVAPCTRETLLGPICSTNGYGRNTVCA
jgi:hypothetical protein